MKNKIYPRPHDKQTVYLKDVVTGTNIEVGDYTIYNDFVNDPRDFEKNNVLYHYPVNGDRLIIGKFCSIACGARFMFTSGNHSMRSLSNYTFPIFFDEWELDAKNIRDAWDNKGDIVIPPQRESIKDYRRITCEKGKYLAKQPQILRNEPTSSQKTMNQTVKTMHRIALVFAMESCMKNA